MSLLDDLKMLGADVDTAVKRIRNYAELYQELVLDSIEDIKEYDVLELNMLLKDNKVDESRELMNRLIPVQNDFIECMEKYID